MNSRFTFSPSFAFFLVGLFPGELALELVVNWRIGKKHETCFSAAYKLPLISSHNDFESRGGACEDGADDFHNQIPSGCLSDERRSGSLTHSPSCPKSDFEESMLVNSRFSQGGGAMLTSVSKKRQSSLASHCPAKR